VIGMKGFMAVSVNVIRIVVGVAKNVHVVMINSCEGELTCDTERVYRIRVLRKRNDENARRRRRRRMEEEICKLISFPTQSDKPHHLAWFLKRVGYRLLYDPFYCKREREGKIIKPSI
jgi:hypothetical protein